MKEFNRKNNTGERFSHSIELLQQIQSEINPKWLTTVTIKLFKLTQMKINGATQKDMAPGEERRHKENQEGFRRRSGDSCFLIFNYVNICVGDMIIERLPLLSCFNQ